MALESASAREPGYWLGCPPPPPPPCGPPVVPGVFGGGFDGCPGWPGWPVSPPCRGVPGFALLTPLFSVGLFRPLNVFVTACPAGVDAADRRTCAVVPRLNVPLGSVWMASPGLRVNVWLFWENVKTPVFDDQMTWPPEVAPLPSLPRIPIVA